MGSISTVYCGLGILVIFGLAVGVAGAQEQAAPLPAWAASLPGTPVVLVAMEDPAGLEVRVTGEATSEVVAGDPADGPEAPGRALRVSVDRSYVPVYEVQVLTKAISAPIAKGDVVLVSFAARSPSAVAGASGVMSFRLQLTGPPWTAPAGGSATLSNRWKRLFVAGVADKDYPAGSHSVAFHLGQQRQVLEFGDIVVLNFGQGVDLNALPRNQLTWPGMEADAPWRAEAQRRIEQHRMAPLTVRVTDADGRAVAGATVAVSQRTRAFQIGSFISVAYFHEPEASSPTSVKAREIFTRLFNRATTPIYWADWGWPYNRGPYLSAARWLHEHGIPTRGHVMIYPTFQYMPADAVALQSDPPRLRQRLIGQIHEIGGATREFAFVEYDVTNELRDCNDLLKLFGRDVVAEWFAEARKVVPGSKLALNENSILTGGGATQANQYLYLDWYRFLKERGVAPQVLGFQGHFGEDFTGPERVWEILDRFATETDAELQITEFDINTLNEEAQAAYLVDFLTACFAHPRVTSFTMWGFWEGDHWMPRAAMYRTDFSPKPAAIAYEALLEAWSTRATLTTDPVGAASVRAFLGTLDITVTHAGKTQRTEVKLSSAGEAVEIEVRLGRE